MDKRSAGELLNILESAESAVYDVLDDVSPDLRIAVLATLLASEICLLPHSKRRAALLKIISDLPGMLDAAERDMREWLDEHGSNGDG